MAIFDLTGGYWLSHDVSDLGPPPAAADIPMGAASERTPKACPKNGEPCLTCEGYACIRLWQEGGCD